MCATDESLEIRRHAGRKRRQSPRQALARGRVQTTADLGAAALARLGYESDDCAQCVDLGRRTLDSGFHPVQSCFNALCFSAPGRAPVLA
jgi:hypothetical protein